VTTQSGGVTVTTLHRPLEANRLGLQFIIEDTGLGIAEDDLRKLFNPFEQGSAGKIRGGSGLGLAISQKYAELFGGELSASSHEGQGSCFTFQCNLELSEAIGLTGEMGEGNDLRLDIRNLKGRKILIADKDKYVRTLFGKELIGFGCRISDAASLREIFQEIKEQNPELIVLDLALPDLNPDCPPKFESPDSGQPIPVVLLSSNPIHDEQRKQFFCGAKILLAKPVDLDTLVSVVTHALYDSEELEAEDLSDWLVQRLAEIDRHQLGDLIASLGTLQPERINAAIEELALDHSQLGRHLSMLADDFRYDEIERLCLMVEED
jgi:CheY-like chemotaxis protein